MSKVQLELSHRHDAQGVADGTTPSVPLSEGHDALGIADGTTPSVPLSEGHDAQGIADGTTPSVPLSEGHDAQGVADGTTPSVPLSEVEGIKDSSDYLRGTIAKGLADGTDRFSDEDKQLLKFHGMYQQKDRDKRLEGEPEKTHTFMLRGRIPGGRLTAEQYLAWDYLGERFGGGALRLTTRQSIQLHGLLKQDLKAVMQEIHSVGLTTKGACGDVVRNVTQVLNLSGSPLYGQLNYFSQLLSDYFQYETTSYVEIWLDDVQQNPVKRERIYGKTYLPRKFKIAVTMAGDNGIDIYINDMAFAATHAHGKIDGFFVFAGGGSGVTHNKPETFPRAADLLGYIPADALIPVATAIVTAHRDFGDRAERRHARLKYVLADRGVDWFRNEVENRSCVKFDTTRPLPAWQIPQYHGFIRKPDGRYNFGLYIMNGRIKDIPGYRLKTAIQLAVARVRVAVQITADQDLLFLDMDEAQRNELLHIFKSHGINTNRPNALYRRAMACVSLPTCALALTESERFFPHVMRDINRLIEKHGLMERAPLVRMTGCPNGCARPYSAEIGIVGQQNGGKYAVFLGGNHTGTRVGEAVLQKVPMPDLPVHLDKAFAFWSQAGQPTERFGDFVNRIGLARMRTLLTQTFD